ncbi:hypothetical protein IAU60_002533 [Kwoniella sp. DSM 27419]
MSSSSMTGDDHRTLVEQSTLQTREKNDRARKKGADTHTTERAKDAEPPRGWVERSQFWTWNCYTVNMGTGGVYILINGISFSFRGQHAIGSVVFIINLVLFLFNTAGMLTRLIAHPHSFYNSLFDHEDGTYLPCFGLAIATLFVGIIDFGVPYAGFWLVRTMEVVFFIYMAMSLVIALTLEITLRGRYRSLESITPADNLLFFPLMLSGTIGGALAGVMPDAQAGYIIIISYWFQGLGFMLSLLKLAVWQARAMLLPNPAPASVPGLLIAVGPPGFTAFAFLNAGQRAVEAFPAASILQTGGNGGQTFQIINVWFSLLLMGLATYFAFSVLTVWLFGQIVDRQVKWSMSWWSFTFPLTGYFMAFGQLGTQLPSDTLKVIQVFGTCWVTLAWLINLPMTVYHVFFARTVGMPKPADDDPPYFVWDGLKDGEVRVRGDGTGVDFVNGGGVLRARAMAEEMREKNPRWASNLILA